VRVVSSPRIFLLFTFLARPVIIVQRVVYGNAAPTSALLAEEDELEQALALAED
jgi:hypothetical protein